MSKLDGKIAVVTGASKGIGAAIASALAKQGAAVVVNYSSDRSGAEAVVDAITSTGGKALAVHGDVAKEADARNLVESAVKEFGGIDILVNNSGVHSVGAIGDIAEAEYRRVFDINVLGMLWTAKAASKHLKEGGSIINLSSAVTRVHPPMLVLYTAAKGAVEALTGVLANELAPRKIRANVVSPGFVITEGTRTAGLVGSEAETGMVAQTPLGRAGQPEDIADVVAFLASDDARWLTGQVVNASGGI